MYIYALFSADLMLRLLFKIPKKRETVMRQINANYPTVSIRLKKTAPSFVAFLRTNCYDR